MSTYRAAVCALMFAAASVAPIAASTLPAQCDGSPTRLGENLPVNTSDLLHSVTHIASIRIRDVVVAWVFQNHLGEVYFQGRTAPGVSDLQIRRAASIVGLADPGTEHLRGFQVRVVRPTMSLGNAPFVVHACF